MSDKAWVQAIAAWMRTAAQCAVPAEFGPWQTIWKRHRRSAAGAGIRQARWSL
ncbi:hypothetical protein EGT67_15540 [Prescottella agglutinans]|uniref:Uncharacterized protein n=1 Tax=Prescottella agglutinans TaxID=1644129 RepID=A0A438BD27_9NOCA|nr:hypothetical protein EGT67_15540 [Prescottella agglutinans]